MTFSLSLSRFAGEPSSNASNVSTKVRLIIGEEAEEDFGGRSSLGLCRVSGGDWRSKKKEEKKKGLLFLYFCTEPTTRKGIQGAQRPSRTINTSIVVFYVSIFLPKDLSPTASEVLIVRPVDKKTIQADCSNHGFMFYPTYFI